MTGDQRDKHVCNTDPERRRPTSELVVVRRAVADLKPNPRSARVHSAKQLAQIRTSIETFGFVTPVAVDAEGTILAGHGRVEAARAIGMERVPTVCLGHLGPAERRAYALADNRIAENAGWDRSVLALELKELDALELDFQIEITGFEGFELHGLLDDGRPAGHADPADKIPETGGPAVTRTGDVWILGEHRLACGDARDPAVYDRLLQGEAARMVFTDPPYNLRIDGVAGGRGQVARREFAMASGEMSPEDFGRFLSASFEAMAAATVDGAILFACIDWRSVGVLLQAGQQVGLTLKNLCVWAKTNAGLGPFYRSQHELVAVFKHGQAAHLNAFGLGGRSGRYRSNLWTYPGVNCLRAGREDELALHPTVKPVALVADAIKDVSRRRELVLDPFGGSGSTLIAAELTRRRARLIEIDPLYADTIARRWSAYSGKEAVLEESGRTFADLEAERGALGTEETAQ